ncbi:MAG: hypothetical protein R2939_05305 [Kofleriaceae bacterium]
MAPPSYPIVDYGPLMKGMVIGGAGILHVFLAQFAIGGGMVMLYFERLAQTGREPAARRLLDSYFKTLVLVSFVLGAVTGVAMWLTTIQVGARTIGVMVDEFHWLWAAEWCCFCLEVVAGYTFLRVGHRLPPRGRLALLALYALAAGQLVLDQRHPVVAAHPGRLARGGGLWAGFFNPSFWPRSRAYRTIVCSPSARWSRAWSSVASSSSARPARRWCGARRGCWCR